MSDDQGPLWRKGDLSSTDRMVHEFTVGDDVVWDRRLVRHDCRASKAHVRMLASIGLLTAEEGERLVEALDEIIRLDAEDRFSVEPYEDCHSAIEAFLIERLGDLGKKVHVGRSRNDQVLTALRLYQLDRLEQLHRGIEELEKALETVRTRDGAVPLPGYTHMQPAMPSSVGMWLGCFQDALKDDLVVLESVRAVIDQNPLGTAAGFGVPVLELDRKMTTGELGFGRIQENPLYAQHSRGKFEGLVIGVAGQVMYDLNRLASDLMLFTTRELGFVALPEKLCTGSSIMPQKRNPDVLELIRASYHVVLGEEGTIRRLPSNLISGYNRDVQLTKGPLMRGLDTTLRSLAMMTRIVCEMTFDVERCREAMGSELSATERAYRLVLEGVPFRDAYRRIADEERR